MSDPLLAEALARIEWKCDLALQMLQMLFVQQGLSLPMLPRMPGYMVCPVCFQTVMHQMDITAGAVKRVCACSTGMLPPLTLVVTTQGTTNGPEQSRAGSAQDRGDGGEPASDSPRRKDR